MSTPNRASRRAKPAKAAATATPAGGRQVNLDTAKAARREARGGRVEVVMGGEVFELPPELPLESIEPLAELADIDVPDDDDDVDTKAAAAGLRATKAALASSLAVLFCDEGLDQPRDDEDRVVSSPVAHADACAWRRFSKHRPTLEDQLALWEGLWEAYDVSLGEALARIGSAGTDGAPSSTT